ncbi:MAG: hypothetical protein ACE5PM_00820 [Candidatus Hydrothermarchaeales archaeon]
MRKGVIIAIIALLTAVAFTAYYYRGIYLPSEVQPHAVSDISVESYLLEEAETPISVGRGRVIFDRAHENNYEVREINPLISKLGEGQVILEFLEDGGLAEKLKYADVFVVICPTEPFTVEENNLIARFLDKGGKLVLISDPTRESEINSISANLGVLFESDYLYNLENNAGNFRYIFIDDFGSLPLTYGLEEVVFYTASSITSKWGIGFASTGTQSSTKGKGKFAAISLIGDSVLAIGDLSFLTEPYNKALDNEQLISNIANFILKSNRVYTADDFPYIFDSVEIVYSNSTLLDEALEMKALFVDLNKRADVLERGRGGDTIYIGYFDDFQETGGELKGISIGNESIDIWGAGTFDRDEVVLVHLSGDNYRKTLSILSNEKEPIQDVIWILRDGEIGYYLLTDNVGIYRYEPSVEEIEEEVLEEERPAIIENLTTTNVSINSSIF